MRGEYGEYRSERGGRGEGAFGNGRARGFWFCALGVGAFFPSFLLGVLLGGGLDGCSSTAAEASLVIASLVKSGTRSGLER